MRICSGPGASITRARYSLSNPSNSVSLVVVSRHYAITPRNTKEIHSVHVPCWLTESK